MRYLPIYFYGNHPERRAAFVANEVAELVAQGFTIDHIEESEPFAFMFDSVVVKIYYY